MNVEFIQALDDIEKDKGISKDVLLEAIETALVSAYKKDFGSKDNVRIEISAEAGEVKVFSRKEVVEEVENENSEISLTEAENIDSKYEIGDIVEIEVTPANFGRIAAQTAKQVVMQRIREAERDVIFDRYKEKEDELITGTIQRFHNDNILIDMGKTEALLPPSEQIAGERYEIGERIKLYVVEVSTTNKGPRILVSRTHPGLLKRLFEIEVPEIFQGLVEIKAVAREAGQRSKMAVSSSDNQVDPVGACVGPKGMRVQAVVEQLNNEKIDIVKWDEDPEEFVANALNPAEVVNVKINKSDKIAEVVVPDFQLSLAIGKEGQNARLAAKLTGWKVDIKKESEIEEEPENIEEIKESASELAESLDQFDENEAELESSNSAAEEVKEDDFEDEEKEKTVKKANDNLIDNMTDDVEDLKNDAEEAEKLD
ncbi:NusA antitermination factor [Halanaerobium saccharolyticum]|uniref:Transcription termination/antitermination protein NusA n=1 Tax=Halanaerobium saccharolyticum TaxID=43595 RepID=A0A4R7Z7Y2_9FIRM|nr:transcription termination factor NusA [Halanaerobium saccharolyticum]RAK11128.1 NusA antitermination factor [Halanaerobium saccharolyticum]TDW06979.1 NusA antitermination factor [Halanaerobium saccharolyticum]TDX63744.1 NusA antitermination factor [Halanaerobium saccharolyticum]